MGLLGSAQRSTSAEAKADVEVVSWFVRDKRLCWKDVRTEVFGRQSRACSLPNVGRGAEKANRDKPSAIPESKHKPDKELQMFRRVWLLVWP